MFETLEVAHVHRNITIVYTLQASEYCLSLNFHCSRFVALYPSKNLDLSRNSNRSFARCHVRVKLYAPVQCNTWTNGRLAGKTKDHGGEP